MLILKQDIANEVRRILCDKFDIGCDRIINHYYLWDDFEADDLDFIEIFMALEEKLNFVGFDNNDFDYYRRLSVQDLIDHVDLVVNPISEIV